MKERVLGYGVIGTGVYCDHYFGTLGPVFKNLRPIGCSDLNTAAAKAAAARWNVPKVYSTEEMLADPEVDIVIILTNPASHYSLTMAALKAGKHVYCEKPLADSLEQANEIVEFAAEKGLFDRQGHQRHGKLCRSGRRPLAPQCRLSVQEGSRTGS